MKVSDILKLKSGVLYTARPGDLLMTALQVMDEHDIGSLVVMEGGTLLGMVTVRELTKVLVRQGGDIKAVRVQDVMDDEPVTCGMETAMDEVRRLMLDSHARYMPVVDQNTLLGVISFHDVARAVVDSQNLENQMLRAYISDTPLADHSSAQKA